MPDIMTIEALILDRIDQSHEMTQKLVEQVHRLELEVTALKTHAKIWGIIAGFTSAGGLAVLQLVLR